MKRVVTLGGGGGQAAIVSALKDLPIELTALTNTVDDGGSSGRLMREWKVFHPGELRNILAALSDKRGQILNHRFTEGELKGHTLGNILLASLELTTGSIQKAVDQVRSDLEIRAKVAPITQKNPALVAKFSKGNTVRGQSAIVRYILAHPGQSVTRISVQPKSASMTAPARIALRNANFVIVSMGDLYSSIAPIFGLSEMQKIWGKLSAKVIWFPNFVVRPGYKHNKRVSSSLSFLQSLVPGFVPDKIIVPSDKPKHRVAPYTLAKIDIDAGAYSLFGLQSEKKYSVADEIERSPIAYSQKKLTSVLKKILR